MSTRLHFAGRYPAVFQTFLFLYLFPASVMARRLKRYFGGHIDAFFSSIRLKRYKKVAGGEHNHNPELFT